MRVSDDNFLDASCKTGDDESWLQKIKTVCAIIFAVSRFLAGK